MYKVFDDIAFQDEFITLKQINPLPWTNNAFEFTIAHNSQVLKQPLWFAHLTLLALLKTEFNTVLDIGSGDGMASWIFKFLDKKVTSLEPAGVYARLQSHPGYTPDHTDDYMDVIFNQKFDAIWCSHVLEHIRNPGNFLDKIYDDLNEGGILALTVPYNDMTDDILWCCFGHHNKYTHSLLVYQLICAGFDCRNIHIANYMGQIGIILKKVSNNLPRINSGIYDDNLGKFFPDEMNVNIGDSGTRYDSAFVNWHYPITPSTGYDIKILKDYKAS
jgi:SAM-dependent methyltransferase